MNIPDILQAGDTITWTDSLFEYPATTWTLKYALRGFELSKIDITSVADGADHDVSVSAATSAAWNAGSYQWEAYVTKGTGETFERKTVDTGVTTVRAALSATTSAVDPRSHAEKVLAAVEAVIEGRATKAQASLSVNGKAIAYMKHDELLRLRNAYRREVRSEKGEGSTVRIEFGSVS